MSFRNNYLAQLDTGVRDGWGSLDFTKQCNPMSDPHVQPAFFFIPDNALQENLNLSIGLSARERPTVPLSQAAMACSKTENANEGTGVGMVVEGRP